MAGAANTNPVNWFEIPVLDLDRAVKFYENVFGYTFMPETTGPYSLAFFPMTEGAAGATGALIKGGAYKPSHTGTIVYFTVDDIDDILKKVNASGGKTVFPKKSIGRYGFIAQFDDTEGNRLALHSMK
jgi:predicted enzyme related to lactoylglutathione lyase